MNRQIHTFEVIVEEADEADRRRKTALSSVAHCGRLAGKDPGGWHRVLFASLAPWKWHSWLINFWTHVWNIERPRILQVWIIEYWQPALSGSKLWRKQDFRASLGDATWDVLVIHHTFGSGHTCMCMYIASVPVWSLLHQGPRKSRQIFERVHALIKHQKITLDENQFTRLEW